MEAIMSEKLKNRSDIPAKYKWNIESMFPDENDWYKDIDWCISESESFAVRFRGRLTESPDTLLEALKMKDEIHCKIEHCMIYAHQKKDEDNRITKYVEMDDKAGSAVSKIMANTAFFLPELLEADEDKLKSWLAKNPDLGLYGFAIEDIMREKAHILSEKEENIMAQMSEVTAATKDIFKMLNNAELNFGEIKDENGNITPVTHGNYISFMQCRDREVRKNAFTNIYEEYKSLINTLATNYNYSVKKACTNARLRNYSSARAHALGANNIDEQVYDNLITVVHEFLPALHKYLNLRKRILGVDSLKMYDVYVPLVDIPKKDIEYSEAVEICKRGLSVLGEEYIDVFTEGTADGNWVDVYENEGKTSGAYSFGSYLSKPFVMLNYSGTLTDVFTLAHEMGHSMNSYYTRKTQPYIYGDYSIFTAEVASTVNEVLLIKYLLKEEKDPEMRKYLINDLLEQFRATVFRQTMFAEFENLAHSEVENGGTLTSEWLCDTYERLNSEYHGSVIEKDEYIRYEWSRIPHFYNDFYVYQYATGYSAATAIAGRIASEGSAAVNDYIRFLGAGSSDYAVETLKIAGVDMSKPEPVRAALETFSSLVDELCELI